MIRFLHAADLHLDSPLRGLRRDPSGPAERLHQESREAFKRLVDEALAEKVAFVVIAGDLFDRDLRDYQSVRFLHQQFSRLSAEKIPVYLIRGNHDAQAELTKDFQWPDGVVELASEKAESHLVPNHPVVIHGQSFPKREVTDNLVPKYPAAVPEKLNVGVLHCQVDGSEGHDRYAPVSLEELQNKGYHYWALGHVHQPAVLSENPHVVYSGNLQGRQVRETGPRGWYLVEADPTTLEINRCEHREGAGVRWEIAKIDLSPLDRPDDLHFFLKKWFADWSYGPPEGVLTCVRVIFEGEVRFSEDLQAGSDHTREAVVLALQSRFGEENFWLEKVRDDTTSPVEDDGVDESLSGEILARLEKRDPDDQLAPDIHAVIGRKLPAELITRILEKDRHKDLNQLVSRVLSGQANASD